jgi:hypothetical protein
LQVRRVVRLRNLRKRKIITCGHLYIYYI